MKFDPYNHERRFTDWYEEVSKQGIEGISETNSKLILQHVSDMAQGKNIGRGSKKGARSFIRLNAMRVRLAQLAKFLEERGIKDIRNATKDNIHSLFDDLQKGKIRRIDGKQYTSTRDFGKDFKNFWHWLMKTNKVKLKDITDELDTSKSEPPFVYFTREELEKMLPYFTPEEQTMMLFMFDTIIRSPTELMNIKVSDLHGIH